MPSIAVRIGEMAAHTRQIGCGVDTGGECVLRFDDADWHPAPERAQLFQALALRQR